MNTDNLKIQLQERGVIMPDPAAVFIAPEVDPARIETGVVLHPGSRLEGKDLSIGPDCSLGTEGPIRLNDCQLGSGVSLGGGSFDRATLLDGVRGGGPGAGAGRMPFRGTILLRSLLRIQAGDPDALRHRG